MITNNFHKSQLRWDFVNSNLRANVLLFLFIIIFMQINFACQRSRQSVKISEFSPVGEVQQSTNFTIVFSKEVVEDSLVNVWLDQAPISFNPAIPGKFQWIDHSKIRFYPDVQLQPSTQYSAEISPRLVSPFGFSLSGDRIFKFSTAQFRVNSASLNFEFSPAKDHEAKLLATIEFNYDVAPAEVIKFISIQYKDAGLIPFKLITTAPGRIVELEAEGVKRGEQEKEIFLKIAEGLKPIGGNVGLAGEFVKPITMPKQQDLKVERLSPKREAPKDWSIQIQFNMPVDLQSAGQFINIEPTVKYKITSSHHYISLRGDFQLGTTYQVVIRKGLRAVDGSELKRDFSSAVTFRAENIPPQLDFVGDGFYITKSGNLNIGLSTINLDKAIIEIDKVYVNNLIYLLNPNDLSGNQRYYWYDIQSLGTRVHESEITIQKIPNEEIVTPINIQDYLKDERMGIFNITARQTDRRWNQASKWVLATDMGIVAKKAGKDLWIWVNSLTKLTPVPNAEVKLISRNNQMLMNKQTNAEGIVVFESYAQNDKDLIPFLITVSAGNDFCFLELTRRQIATSDFEIGGAAFLEHGYEAFLYNERGVYRPGETAHLAGIVRGENMTVPTPFPVLFRVKGPDERILEEKRATLNEQGGVEFSISIPNYAKTGKYNAMLLIGEKEELGRTSFNVEEFIPDRMKVTLATDKDEFTPGETINIDVEAMTLFGPPASDRRVQADIEIESFTFSPAKWKSFTFVDEKKSFEKIRADLGDQVLDSNGKFRYTYVLPKKFDVPSALRGILSSTVLEPGGRGVSAYRSVIIHPYQAYVGLRKAKQGYAEPNQRTDIEFIVLNPAEQPVADRKVEITFYRIYWHSILKKVDAHGQYRYVSEEVEDQVDQFTVTSGSNIGSFAVTPGDYGRYRVVAKDIASGASASIWFYASGWGYAPWAMDNPDRIELDLDKEKYQPGEKAKVQVRAPFAGKLLLTIEREKILSQRVVTLSENTATLEIPITEQFKPNAFISAHLIRSTESLERDTPVRAFGVVPLMVDNSANKLNVELSAPDEIRPNSKLTVDFKVSGQSAGTPFVTIAAVDEGILQLTDFQSPDAHGYFFGKKRLAVETHDIYGVVLPEIKASSSSASGDVEAARRRLITPVSVTRVKPVAFWTGLVKTDGRGRGKVSFDLPQFNGTIRLMAVAFAGNKFGNQEKKFFVREPIVLSPTFPRFVASGDAFVVPVSVYNGTGSNNNFEVKLTAKGPIQITDEATKTVQVEKGKEGQVYFQLKADETMGKLEFNLSAKGGGEQSKMSVDVPLRPPVPFITLSGRGSVLEGKPVTFTFPSDWIAGTTDFSLTISAFPAVRFTNSLQYLLSYPHGCIEQTTSKLFPLLYFNDLAKTVEPELFQTKSVDYFLAEGISKLESMQNESGAFSYWPEGDYINNWSSIYAAHFLVEARKAGYAVSDRVYNRMITALRSQVRSYRGDDAYSFQAAVYACYVLALAGKPEKSTMNYIKNSALDNLQDYSQYQLAGAYALAGDRQTARTLLPKTVTPTKKEDRETGRNFNSSIRSRAIMLEVLAEFDENNPAIPVLVEELNKSADNGRWYTTQENAFAFLALGKIMKKQSQGKFTGTAAIDGKLYTKFDMQSQQFSDKDWSGKKVTIEIKGEGTCYYSWRADGIPSKLSIDEYDNDLMVRRHYLNEQGIPVDYSSFKQGDMVIAKITVKALTQSLDNVAIVDMLPAGFEIENPRLQSRKGVDWIQNNAFQPMYMDIRDDRMILYGDFEYGREETFYYGIRAVTEGTFILPPIRAEAMYAPMKASVASSGKIVIGRP